MSSYENYTRISKLYDATRKPVGTEIILGCLAATETPLEDLVLVDAGCGTGNYTRQLASRVGRVEAVDLNAGMLEQARSKLAQAEAEGRVVFHQASIEALPLGDETADAVMLNQVLHHLNDDPASDWPAVRAVMGECFRVLRPGGVVVVNICSHEQLTRGWWYFVLIPEAVEKMCGRHVPLTTLQRTMAETGFSHLGRFVPVDGVLQGQTYFDPRAPLDPDWRAGDSIWTLVSADELSRVLDRIRAMEASGELKDFFERHDAVRRDIGQFTMVAARKPPPGTGAGSGTPG